MAVVRLLLKLLLDRLLDPLPHLRRRRPGEGHDQKAVDLQRMLPLCDHPHNPLHQNRRLPASRRGRDQQIPAAALNDLPLFPCPIDCHTYLSSRNAWLMM